MTTPIKVLVTGFGLFLDVKRCPLWEIVRRLSASIVGLDDRLIQLIVPNDPMTLANNETKYQTTALNESHNPDLVVHMGLDVNSDRGIFKVERSAPREGYHEFPDIRRKVFTRMENKTAFAKSPAALSRTLDIDAAAEVWSAGCASITLATQRGSQRTAQKGKKSEMRNALVQLSDDVETYVCGFCYYVALFHLQTHTEKRHAIFFHVPPLE